MNIIIRNKRTYKGPGEPIHRPSPKGRAKGSVLGNPFPLHDESQRLKVIKQYKQWLWNHIKNYEALNMREMNNQNDCIETYCIGKELDRLYELAKTQPELNLICFCAPKACHGDVIKTYLEWRHAKEINSGN